MSNSGATQRLQRWAHSLAATLILGPPVDGEELAMARGLTPESLPIEES